MDGGPRCGSALLAGVNYPAPRVICTTEGALIGRCHDWSALLLTFVPGHIADNSPADFHAIGAALGRLHRVDVRRAAVATPAVPPARWHPTSMISGWIEGLVAVGGQIPHELQGIYQFSLATLQRVVRWDAPPLAILHADPWANNAIRTPEGEMVLVDWDGAGLGPATLDLGYLLVACHAGLPDWPQITPHAERIAAVLAGYCQERTLTPAEFANLPDAIRFAEAFRAAQWLPTGVHGPWQANARQLKFLFRYPVTDAIAAIVERCIAGSLA